MESVLLHKCINYKQYINVLGHNNIDSVVCYGDLCLCLFVGKTIVFNSPTCHKVVYISHFLFSVTQIISRSLT